MLKKNNSYMPDVLDCLANLSNDEVFTPPEIANKMLDLLPEDIFKSKETTFLDPFTKSGVFLREITKRLLKNQIPNYEKTALEIEIIEKEAIQDAVVNKILDFNDIDYKEKAKKIGKDAIDNHPKACEFYDFEEKLQNELDRILSTQVFGIAITELTAQLTRRSLYCSKDAAGKYSISSAFKNSAGNIRFMPMKHEWKNDTCIYCGASKKMFERPDDIEQHAYEFIHNENIKEIYNMEFTVICGNPPYQLSDGGAQASAIPIYNKFIEQAKKLNPKYLTMIIPSRWMTGGKGLDSFRKIMINDKCIKELHDFADPKMCFSGVDIKGGVCYFLRDKNYNGDCKCVRHDVDGESVSIRPLCEEGDDIFIRDNRLISIKNKVSSLKEASLSTVISPRKPYGLSGDITKNAAKYGLPELSTKPINDGYEVLGLGEKQQRTWRYISKDYPLPRKGCIDKYKIFVPRAYGCGTIGEIPSTPVLGTPVLGTPVQICTETFLEIGPFESSEEASNVLKYLKTKFFRCLVGIRKQTQDATSRVYTYVPLQNFTATSDIDWIKSIKEIDEQLYKKYNLTQEEINFIESVIKHMD